VAPHRPDDPRQLVRQGDRGLVVAAGALPFERPGAKSIGCFARLACSNVVRAPWMRSIRRQGSPFFEIRPRRRTWPLADSRGVSPRALARWRAEGKRWTSPRLAARAVAVSRPTPGMVRSRVMRGLSPASASSWCRGLALRARRSRAPPRAARGAASRAARCRPPRRAPARAARHGGHRRESRCRALTADRATARGRRAL